MNTARLGWQSRDSVIPSQLRDFARCGNPLNAPRVGVIMNTLRLRRLLGISDPWSLLHRIAKEPLTWQYICFHSLGRNIYTV